MCLLAVEDWGRDYGSVEYPGAVLLWAVFYWNAAGRICEGTASDRRSEHVTDIHLLYKEDCCRLKITAFAHECRQQWIRWK